MDLEELSKPFPRELIKQRKGNWGKSFDYVEVGPVIARLNEAFGGHWSFRILWPYDLSAFLDPQKREQLKEVGVLAELSVAHEHKQQFGASQVTRHSETGALISIVDDLKAAASDALKKCATHFGVALYLYEDHGKEKARSSPDQGNNRSGTGPKPITEKQAREIARLTEKLESTEEDVKARVAELFGKPLEKLTSKEASDVIGKMTAQIDAK